ncbi:LysM peptidoglycan-binding domain-containing protein [Mucilaginibacter ginkgonis]|uniref:LysM peptidoglycan-binding domain-containing protein n=1 Tax=Mucilaginibacter ginkgonis TaxID=2682091 RepID=A0A6I4I0H9_9SPHI|nr:LysM peptidoglycan-binding domain-containing protein [Mucilaginibacter ginkgonis]QQL50988.1 LysM peptidoglycan-binding domain-containing protein [Mucilaginibacter ginkgonis]
MRSNFLLLSVLVLPLLSKATTPVDSIGVENQNGKKVILHKVDAKDTYYSIARRYNIKPQLVIKFNSSAALHIGDVVKVPTELSFVQTATGQPAATQAVADGAVIQYKVAQHEYLFGIAKRFNTTVEDIKKLNNLTKDALQPGQILNIHQGGSTTVIAQQQQPTQTTVVTNKPVVVAQSVPVTPAATQPVNTGQPGTAIQYKVTKREYLYSVAKRFNTTVEKIKEDNQLTSNALRPGQVLVITSGAAQQVATVETVKTDTIPPAKRDTTRTNSIADSLAEHKAPSRYGLFEKNEHGIATWMDDASFDANKKLVLHRTAPIGTVIKITNPMTSRTTFAKVVGRFTDNESTKDVIIVMTKNVAESLGALDKRFRVNISYGVSNE